MLEEIPERRPFLFGLESARAALRLATDTIDIGVQIPRLTRNILRAIHVRCRDGRLITTWYYSRLTESYIEHALRRELSRNPAARRCDAILTAFGQGDLAILPIPFFTLTDITWDAFVAMSGSVDAAAALLRMTRHPLRVVASGNSPSTSAPPESSRRANGWLVASLSRPVCRPERYTWPVRGSQPGGRPRTASSAIPSKEQGERQLPPLRERAAPRRRLLFVGRDFYRKGGDLVVSALAVLRREYDPQITLTVAGPQTWPLPGSPPDGVRFLGSLSPQKVAPLYDRHDLFVMPSRGEPFGLVFAEALARGLPCVARDAFAMPEIVTPGVSGALIKGDDENELAAAIAAVLEDDALYESCYQRAPEMAEYFSWERTALEVTDIITKALPLAP